MNRQRYRLVFSQNVGGLVPAAENTRGRGKAASGAGRASGAVVLLGSLLLAAPALADVPVPRASNFVTAGQAGYRVNGNQAFINQVGNKAILNWQQFNVGAGKTVQFGQVNDLVNNQLVQGASFTTLNRIWDLNPSVIAGSITQAPGQKANVILVNTNGIAFMGGSQVNLASFTASTLNMADKYILNGLLGDNANPQFEKALDGTEARGFIQVFEGAKISAGSQGRVMLIAPTVVNAGSIEAPDGQVILAAGTRAFLRSDDSADLSVRGLLVEVDSSADASQLGHATNTGAIAAARGNVTMVGYAVNQMGLARATSSVVANGSVYLMAKDTSVLPPGQGTVRTSTRAGEVVLGTGSRTEVLFDQDTTTTTDAQDAQGNYLPGLAQASQIRVLGQKVYLADGSTIKAPSGDVRVVAVDDPQSLTTLGQLPDGIAPSTTARLHMARGAVIDVAGVSGAQVSAGRNTLEVELRGDELKDSPVNQSGPLRGEKVYVDIEQALANADAGKRTLIAEDSLLAYRGRLERGAEERSTQGGQVGLQSQGQVVLEQGSTIDLSGGSVAFSEAVVKTTVLGAKGKLVDLANADADTRYQGIVSRYTIGYDKWNQKEVIELPSAQRVATGYTEGRDAGALNIVGKGPMYVQADVQGRTVSGERQIASGVGPRGAQLSINSTASNTGTGATGPNRQVVIDRAVATLPTGFAMNAELPDALKDTLTLDADLLAKDRVAEFTLVTDQAAEVRSALRAPQGGVVNLNALDLKVKADIDVQGGSIALGGINVTVADGVNLSARGAFVNQRARGGNGSLPTINGGSVSLNANVSLTDGVYVNQGTVTLGQGVNIDVSGGALIDKAGKVTAGKGGKIAITGYAVPGLANATLSAYGLQQGGTLTVSSHTVDIGGTAPSGAFGNLQLDPLFFTKGGFSQYNVSGLERLSVADNTVLRPQVTSRELRADAVARPTGTAMADITTALVKPDNERPVASLALTASQEGADTGTLRIGSGAHLQVDNGGTVALAARNVLDIQGAVVAHGGNITATVDRSKGSYRDAARPQNNLWLGANAVLDASGVADTFTDARGRTTGEVLAGGSVILKANTGALVAEAGANINISGAAPVRVDVANESGGLGRDVASDAGRLEMFADNALLFDATVSARGGSPNQRGGTLDVTLSNNLDPQFIPTQAPVVLLLANSVAPQTAGLSPDQPVSLMGEEGARLGTDALEAAGFDRMRFSSRDGIALADGLALGAGRGQPLREVHFDASRIETRGSASLTADAVRLTNERQTTGTTGAAAGAGTLTANARLLELAGNVRLTGMAASTLTGTEQIQLNSVGGPATVETVGDLTLRGGVVTPGNNAQVTLKASGRDVRVESVGQTALAPLSALGRLRIEAQNITQAGRVVAPLGQIDLAAQGNLVLEPGSITSVSALPGQVLLGGKLQNGVDWLVEGLTPIDALPQKSVRLSGGAVDVKSGALVNVSGGGDLQAYEFTAGPGGSRDILADKNTYAVLPGYQSGFAPSNTQETTGRPVGEAVYLSGIQGLADGVYTLLPAHYALLPGALAIRLGDAAPLLPGQTYTRQDGVQVAAGYITDSRTNAPRSADWRAIEVLTREQVRQRSEIAVASASTFFGNQPNRPVDAGLLSIATQSRLELNGTITGGPAAGGRGAAVDISAPNLVIAGPGTTVVAPGATVLDVARLNDLNADSLLLGATRSTTTSATGTTTALDVGASTVTLANDAQTTLRAGEVMLAATDTVTLRAGSAIDAQGADGDAGAYTTAGNGAFVRAASTTATFNRTGSPDRSVGALAGEAGSLVQAAKAITLDATQDTRFNGQALFRRAGQVVAGKLGVGASRVSLGSPTSAVDGITYSQADLNALLGLEAFSLTSYSTVDVYGSVEVGGVDANSRPTLKNLTLQSAGLRGMGAAGDTAQVRAETLTLSNNAGASYTAPGTAGAGSLVVQSDTLVLGEGSKTLGSFGSVAITAGQVVGRGEGRTDLQSPTTLATARLGGENGARQTLNGGAGTLALSSTVPAQPLPASSGLGASWTLNAGDISFDTAVDLASGALTLNAATGNVALGANANINVAGRNVAFFDETRGTAGGTVALNSTNGNVVLDAASRVNVSGAAGADGGTLKVNAVKGTATLVAGNLIGQTPADAAGKTGEGARARFDVGTLANASAISAALQSGGFTGERTLRARTGDITLAAGDTVQAKQVTISADAGSITVAGTVSASGAQGGQVGLYAGQSVMLASGSRVDAAATAAGGDGGRVEIGAGSGALDLQTGSTVDVSAAAGGQAGRVLLRAQRVGNDVAVTALNSTITGAERVDLEAVRVYGGISTLNATGASAGSTLTLATINNNDTAYAANHGAVKSRLGQTGNAAFHIVSGTEVRSSGDLALGNGTAATDWNLQGSAAGGEAGVLTLRAQGNLNINSNLSDGFLTATAPYTSNNSPLVDRNLRGGQSWTYRMVAGADTGAANPMTTNAAGTGDLNLAAGKLVRTGGGDIRMAAGGNIDLKSNTSVVYTAGRQANALPGFTNPVASQRAFFTEGGGDIEMTAGNDIKGVASAQLYSNWLFRQGRLGSDGDTYASGDQTAWWVRFDQFQQGVATLGGGDVTVRAGNNVSNLSASAPTQGRTGATTASANGLIKSGGGNVTVEAGADVVGGQFHADEGQLRMVAAKGVDQAILALGNAQATVRGRDDVAIRAVINPHLVAQISGGNTSSTTTNVSGIASQQARKSLFSTYGDNSAVDLSSLLGDVVLYSQEGNDAKGVPALGPLYSQLSSNPTGIDASTSIAFLRGLLNVLPARLAMTSFGGNVEVDGFGGTLNMLPSSTGQLELLAQDSVRLNTRLVMSDKDPASIPSAARPVGYGSVETEALSANEGVLHATVPVHTGDATTAKVYAVQGDVSGASSAEVLLDLSKAVDVRAGRDVSNFNLRVQHANASDRSRVQAGRDVSFADRLTRNDPDGIRVGGLGSLEVQAGRDVNLGTSGGIVSRGDLDNSSLPAGGTNIRVLAGVGAAGLDAAGTLQRLSQRLSSGAASESDLWLARWLTGNTALTAASASSAVAEVAALAPEARRDRVMDFLYTALRESGRDANRADSGYVGDFSRGYAALELAFPGIGEKDANGRFTRYDGNINLFASRIKTERGGNIDLLVPGGGMVVGLANTPEALTTSDNNNLGELGVLGVVTASAGNIRGATRDDILVNQSRILTVQGGSIVLWSSEGDIDAGKGKKTAAAAPPPVVKFDPVTGAVTQELQGAATGSGIGALKTGDTPAGDVDLIAPKGTVNAGDAGIRAGNLNIAALVVLGADNISVSGTSAGTPVADTSAVSAASSGATSGGDDTGKVVEALNQAAAESAKAAQELAAALRPSVVRVDVLGFGE